MNPMSRQLTSLNVILFEEKTGPDARPSFVTFGGQDALGRRIETISVATPVATAACRKLLQPALGQVEERAKELAEALRTSLAEAERMREAALAIYQKGLRRLFAEASGQAVNHTLPTEAEARLEATLPV